MLCIAFTGPKESGKTLGAQLTGELSGAERWRVMSFAAPLKEIVAKITPDGMILKPRDRELMQFIGTEYFRKAISADYWTQRMTASIVEQSMKYPNVPILVDDCRFLDEAACLRNLDFKIVRIRPAVWEQESHQSEREWQLITPDYEIVNPKSSREQYRKDLLEVLGAITFAGASND